MAYGVRLYCDGTDRRSVHQMRRYINAIDKRGPVVAHVSFHSNLKLLDAFIHDL